jgi:hypothetical protein
MAGSRQQPKSHEPSIQRGSHHTRYAQRPTGLPIHPTSTTLRRRHAPCFKRPRGAPAAPLPTIPPRSSSWSATGCAMDLRSKATLLAPHRTRYAAVMAPAEEKARCHAGGSAQTFGLSAITLPAIPDPLRTKNVFCSSMLPSPAQGASASSISSTKPIPCAPPLYSECRVQWPVHGNSQEP